MTNAISVILILIFLALLAFQPIWCVGERLQKGATPVMLMIFIVLLYAMPDHVFSKGTTLYSLETTMHNEVGLTGQFWSRLSLAICKNSFFNYQGSSSEETHHSI